MSDRSEKHLKPANNAARERSRVQSLRAAFLDLQRSLPSVPPDTKLSKLDVLVLATAYIYHLTQTLDLDDGQNDDHQLTNPKTTTKQTATTSKISYHTRSPGVRQSQSSDLHYHPNLRQSCSNISCVDGSLETGTHSHCQQERYFPEYIRHVVHNAPPTPASSSLTTENTRVSTNTGCSRMIERRASSREKIKIRPKLFTDKDGAVGILHPVKGNRNLKNSHP